MKVILYLYNENETIFSFIFTIMASYTRDIADTIRGLMRDCWCTPVHEMKNNISFSNENSEFLVLLFTGAETEERLDDLENEEEEYDDDDESDGGDDDPGLRPDVVEPVCGV